MLLKGIKTDAYSRPSHVREIQQISVEAVSGTHSSRAKPGLRTPLLVPKAAIVARWPTGITQSLRQRDGDLVEATFCIPSQVVHHAGSEPEQARSSVTLGSSVASNLTVDGLGLDPLGAHVQPDARSSPDHLEVRNAHSTLLVVRHRYVGNGMREDIVVRNLGRETATLSVLE